MRHLPLVILASMASACCVRSSEPPLPPRQVEQTPNTDAIMALAGRFGWASACPVSSTMALTAAHVVDMAPLDMVSRLMPFAWEDADGHAGIVSPTARYWFRDLAELGGQFQHWYPVAKNAPQVGEALWFAGWDYRSKTTAMGNRIWKTRLIRVRARYLVYDPDGDPGTSGSCILNTQGEVVGVVRGWVGVGFERKNRVGLGVALYGEEFSGEAERVPEVDSPTRPTDTTPGS